MEWPVLGQMKPTLLGKITTVAQFQFLLTLEKSLENHPIEPGRLTRKPFSRCQRSYSRKGTREGPAIAGGQDAQATPTENCLCQFSCQFSVVKNGQNRLEFTPDEIVAEP
jgi:hypothetical protein